MLAHIETTERKWARTSPAMIVSFYDQTHPRASVGRIAGFRTQPPSGKDTSKKKGKSANGRKSSGKRKGTPTKRQTR